MIVTFSYSFRFIGLYAKILGKFTKDIIKFGVVYFLVLFALSGSVLLSFRATNDLRNVR